MSNVSLLPERRDQLDFFVCDIFDAVPKDDMGSMEHPMFALDKKRDLRERHYEHKGHYVTIIPSVRGLATIHDKDVLIYCISQLVAAHNEGRDINKTVRVTAYDLLKSTNRGTGGREYMLLVQALDRLAGTRIATNIEVGQARVSGNFGLIEEYRIIERSPTNSRMVSVEIRLSEWLFKAINASQVLTIHHDYFRLRRGIERRLYELARKHCGEQSRWPVSLDLLQKKCGSKSPLKKFRLYIMQIIDAQALPEYRMMYDERADKVTFYHTTPKGQCRQSADLIQSTLDGNTPRFGFPQA